MRKGVQDTPNPAGIKNPNGEKAIERWGQGTDHQKNRHEGYVNTSPRYKSFAISRLATISLQTYRQKPARPMPYITLHTMDMTSSHIITLHTIQKQKIAKNKINIQDLQNQEQPILRNKKPSDIKMVDSALHISMSLLRRLQEGEIRMMYNNRRSARGFQHFLCPNSYPDF